MKRNAPLILLFAALLATLYGNAADPTVPTAAMADVLRRSLPISPDMTLHALVVGAHEKGVALVGATPASAKTVRKGMTLSETVEGVRVTAEIRAVTPVGVELAAADSAAPLMLPGSFSPLAAPTNPPAEFLRHLECVNVPIDRIVRLIADQTGVNISASDATAKKNVSIFLRNVTAEAAVEEICRATGLWFRRDPDGGVIRITTMAEYSENLTTFREEMTRTFTLLYPNVVEIASVIYGIYPDRTLLSLGEEEFLEEDEYDLSRRFRRFRVLSENGNSQFMNMQAPQSSSAGNVNGSGVFSFSRGSALSNLSQWERLRRRGALGKEDLLSPEAMLAAATNTAHSANIFVSMSRKNNKLIVRTSDVKVMDEITRLVKDLDVPTPMVLMEVKILELTLDDNFTASFNWTADGLFSTRRESDISWAAGMAQTAMSTADPTFAFAAVSEHVLAQIQLMAKDGKVKTLATPTLLVANNEVSRIFSGEERPIVTGWSAGSTVTSQGGITSVQSVPQIEQKDIGTMLLISPNINADKTVTLRLLQENSEIAGKADVEVYATESDAGEDSAGDGQTASGKRQIDYVSSRSITGTFIAKDGLTVMAGGLVRETESEQYYRTPFLGSIPFLGWLFRGTEKVKNRTEMIILIKPHVIMTPQEGGKISKTLLKAISEHDDPKKHTFKDDVKNLLHN